MLVLYLTITIAAFIYPQSGIRANMRKQKLLVSEQITDQLPCTQGGARSEDTDPEKLAALLATRSHIQSPPDWPIWPAHPNSSGALSFHSTAVLGGRRPGLRTGAILSLVLYSYYGVTCVVVRASPLDCAAVCAARGRVIKPCV